MSAQTSSETQVVARTATPSQAVSRMTTAHVSLKVYLSLQPNADRRVLLQQIAVFLARYHIVDRVIHGDVKMANVFVDPRGSAQLPRPITAIPITTAPRAPARPQEYLPMTTATDIYAFAWLVFHVYTDIDPQDLARKSNLMHLISSGIKPNQPGPQTLAVYRGLSQKIWDMLLRCWDISPAERPTIAEVLLGLDLPISASSHPQNPSLALVIPEGSTCNNANIAMETIDGGEKNNEGAEKKSDSSTFVTETDAESPPSTSS